MASIRSFLHKAVDKSFNTIDSIKNGTRKASKSAAEHLANRLSKDPTDLKIARLEKEKAALIAAKNEKKGQNRPQKNQQNNPPAPQQ